MKAPKKAQGSGGANRMYAQRLASASLSRTQSAPTAARSASARSAGLKPKNRFRRAAAMAAFLLLGALGLAPRVDAATYYVRPDGNNALAGTSYAAGWRTIAQANATVASGDVVIIYPGAYTDAPNPAAASTGTWITYVGSLAGPSAVLIQTPVTVTKTYLSLKGMQFSNGLTVGNAAWKDSLAYLLVQSSFDIAGPDYCVFDHVQSNAMRLAIARTSGDRAIGDEFYNCSFPYLGLNYTGTANIFETGVTGSIGGEHVDASLDSCLFYFNTFTMQRHTGNGNYLEVHFAMSNCTWKYNTHNFTSYANDGQASRGFALRDSTYGNLFVGESWLQGATSFDADMEMAASGSISRSVYSNEFDSCTVHSTNGMAWHYQAGMTKNTLRYNTIVSRNGRAMVVDWMSGRNWIDHNTFVGSAGNKYDHGVVQFTRTAPRGRDTTLVTNNIFAAWSDPAMTNDVFSQGSGRYAVYYDYPEIDSSFEAGGSHAAHLISDHNLYSYYGWNSSDSLGQRSIGFELPCCGQFGAQPIGTRNWSIRWCAACDDSSYYGSAQFDKGDVDSTYATFDPAIGSLSMARGHGTSGTDIGSTAFAVYPVATVSPTTLDFTDVADEAGTTTRTFTIVNNAVSTVSLVVSAVTSSLSGVVASPSTATIAKDGSQTVTLTFTHAGLTTYRSGYVTVTSNDPARPTQLVLVRINAGGARAPADPPEITP